MTTACGPHNRNVGPKPGQYTTSVLTDGPDAGRTAWRLNTEDGMPPNEARINRVNDIGPQIVAYLKAIRAQREQDQQSRDQVDKLPIRDVRDTPDSRRIRRMIAGCWTIRHINLDNDDRLRAGP